jgi:hypothetical protein
MSAPHIGSSLGDASPAALLLPWHTTSGCSRIGRPTFDARQAVMPMRPLPAFLRAPAERVESTLSGMGPGAWKRGLQQSDFPEMMGLTESQGKADESGASFPWLDRADLPPRCACPYLSSSAVAIDKCDGIFSHSAN